MIHRASVVRFQFTDRNFVVSNHFISKIETPGKIICYAMLRPWNFYFIVVVNVGSPANKARI